MFMNIGSTSDNSLVKVQDLDGKIIEMNAIYLNPNPSAYDLILGDGMSSMTINSGVS